MYHISQKFGKEDWFFILGIFIPIVWFIILAVDKSTWNGAPAQPTNNTPQPEPAMPITPVAPATTTFAEPAAETIETPTPTNNTTAFPESPAAPETPEPTTDPYIPQPTGTPDQPIVENDSAESQPDDTLTTSSGEPL